MKNQLSALSDSSLVLMILKKKKKKKTGVGGPWLKYLLLIPLMLLTMPFVFCLFHKIIFLYYQVYDWAFNGNND